MNVGCIVGVIPEFPELTADLEQVAAKKYTVHFATVMNQDHKYSGDWH